MRERTMNPDMVRLATTLYAEGLSLRDISDWQGIPVSTVRNTLIANGVVLRRPGRPKGASQ